MATWMPAVLALADLWGRPAGERDRPDDEICRPERLVAN
jgi:hypothetical protein